ncbi:MAG: hypothetical protein A2987_00575 [Omnitrophica bacterium RIFCSPLOWO2_01_FULL_45_10]|nr:MAG: hypothetical protein A2987_00575 [Omnitrophica bacterium RIFCSPLOWO2_01_FULL_45_10]
MHKLNVLENGLKVATQTMDQMSSVSLGIWIRVGARYEAKENNGVSHLLEHILFKGTTTRDTKAIKEEIEGRGGSFNGFTSEEHTCYLVKLLSKDCELGIDILSDMVLNPAMDAQEIEKEKDVIIEEINMYKDIPSHYVHEILAEMMWPDQPLGMPLAGTAESVAGLTKKNLVSYKETYYNPKNILVIGAGGVDMDALLAISKKYLSKMKPNSFPGYEKAKLDQPEPRIRITSKEVEQTHIALGLHSTDRFHPDRYALSLVNIILGANMSSRLYHRVRDELALCYEISSSVRRYEDAGAFTVSVGLDDKKVTKALSVIAEELERIKREPVSSDELRRAKEYYKGQLLFALEDTMNNMLWLGEKILEAELDYEVRDILAHIEKVGAEDAMRVSKEIFREENVNLAIIGPDKFDEKAIREAVHIG